MIKIKNTNYLVIQGFMVNDLNLKGNELLIYAIIYGFSQDEEQRFSGSLQYLADWTNSTKQGVIKNLKSLVEKGLIVKEESKFKGVNIVEYYSTKFNGGIKQSLTGGIKQSLTNNIVNDNIYNNNKKENIKRKSFVKPTIEEINQYCRERNNGINANAFYDFYESKNWYVGKNKMKDWKACVRTWEQRSNKIIAKEPEWLGKRIVKEIATRQEQEEMDKMLGYWKG